MRTTAGVALRLCAPTRQRGQARACNRQEIVVRSAVYLAVTIVITVILLPVRSPLTITRSPANAQIAVLADSGVLNITVEVIRRMRNAVSVHGHTAMTRLLRRIRFSWLDWRRIASKPSLHGLMPTNREENAGAQRIQDSTIPE